MDRPHHHAGFSKKRARPRSLTVQPEFCEFSQAEIEDFDIAIATQHDVLRFDIAMHNMRLMSCSQCAGDLNSDVENLAELQTLLDIRARSV